jgi:hypothetical protein
VSAIRRIDAGWAVRVAGLASLVAQQATSAVYEPPTLVLAYPAPGVSVPADNATVIFHYAASDVTDPLDLRRFQVLVDGVDRTAHFRTTADAAWGTIAGGGDKGVRAHDVRARVCTIRGACVEVGAIVMVTGSDEREREAVGKKRWGKFIDIALEMLRRLLKP